MATKKAALGRGLNALLPSQSPEESTDEPGGEQTPKSRLYRFDERVRLLGRVADIEVDHVRPNPYQPRKDFDETALDELSASIQQLGIIQPITVRALDKGQFEIISGERRLRAARRAGVKRIPAYIREADTEEMLEMALVENVQREALNPIEVAVGYQRLIEECGLTQEQVAQKVSKNRSTVANFLRLLRLPPRLQAGLRDGRLTAGHARALVTLDDEELQLQLMNEIDQDDLSVREVEDRVRQILHAEEQAQEPEPDLFTTAEPTAEQLQFEAYTNRLRSRLSTQIQIKHKSDRQGGRIEIAYYSKDDLERLLDLLDG